MIFYLVLFFIIHIPLDAYMLLKRRIHSRQDYPSQNPSTSSFASLVITTLAFWAIVIGASVSKKIFQMLLLGDFSASYQAVISGLGLAIFWFASVIEFLGRLSRGAYLAKEKSQLATTLGHGIVRHPQYFAYSAYFIALPLIFLNPFLFLLVPGIWGYYQTAKLEDEVLEQQFGSEFKEYAAKTPMFIPFLKKK